MPSAPGTLMAHGEERALPPVNETLKGSEGAPDAQGGGAADGALGIPSDQRLKLFISTPFRSWGGPKAFPNAVFGAGDATKAAYVRALVDEIESASQGMDGMVVDEVEFGGGPASSLTSGQLSQVMRAVRKCYRLAPNVVVRLRDVPGGVTVDFAGFCKNAGADWVELEVLSTDVSSLKSMGLPPSLSSTVNCFQVVYFAGAPALGILFADWVELEVLSTDVSSLKSMGLPPSLSSTVNCFQVVYFAGAPALGILLDGSYDSNPQAFRRSVIEALARSPLFVRAVHLDDGQRASLGELCEARGLQSFGDDLWGRPEFTGFPPARSPLFVRAVHLDDGQRASLGELCEARGLQSFGDDLWGRPEFTGFPPAAANQLGFGLGAESVFDGIRFKTTSDLGLYCAQSADFGAIATRVCDLGACGCVG